MECDNLISKQVNFGEKNRQKMKYFSEIILTSDPSMKYVTRGKMREAGGRSEL